MFDVVHLCVERDPVRVATGLAVAGLAAAGPAVAGLAVAGLVAAGLAEAGLVEQRAVHLREEEDAVVGSKVSLTRFLEKMLGMVAVGQLSRSFISRLVSGGYSFHWPYSALFLPSLPMMRMKRE